MEKLNFSASVLEQWNATAQDNQPAMDVYLTPVNPSVCPKHGDYKRVRYLGYTGTANVLDFTACTIPITVVDPEHDLVDRDGETDSDGNAIPAPTCTLDQNIRNRYDPKVYAGLPVTIQIIGRRLEEEKVLAIAHVLQSLL